MWIVSEFDGGGTAGCIQVFIPDGAWETLYGPKD